MLKTEDKNGITDLQMGVMIGTAMEFQNKLMKLMQEYENKGIKEISISVLRNMLSVSLIENIGPKGLVGTMIREGVV